MREKLSGPVRAARRSGIVSCQHQKDDGEPGHRGRAPRMHIWAKHLPMRIVAHHWFPAPASCEWNAADLLDSTPVLDYGLRRYAWGAGQRVRVHPVILVRTTRRLPILAEERWIVEVVDVLDVRVALKSVRA